MEQNVRIVGMLTDDLRNPVGIPAAQPVFSWKTESDTPGYVQASYRIELISGGETVWDSGEVASPQSVAVVCPLTLAPRASYTWTVTTAGQNGAKASGTASFETGLPADEPFGGASWIAVSEEGERLPVFRREFEVGPCLKTARLYSSGLGAYENFLNGARVGRIEDGSLVYDELKPGFTETQKRKFYNTYDIAPFLKEGRNALAAIRNQNGRTIVNALRLNRYNAGRQKHNGFAGHIMRANRRQDDIFVIRLHKRAPG